MTFTVKFVDWNEDVLKTETVRKGSGATAPADPTRDGYVFKGWDKAFDNVTGDMTVTAVYEEDTEPMIYIDSVTAAKGSTDVVVKAYIKNNPGVLAMTLKLEYDESVLTLTKIERGTALNELDFATPRDLKSGIKLPWDAESIKPDDITNGDIVLLTFSISDSASNGDYTISLSRFGGIIDNDLEQLDIGIRNGAIIVQ